MFGTVKHIVLEARRGALRHALTEAYRHGRDAAPLLPVYWERHWEEPHAWPVPTLWTIRLTPLYDATLVEIFHHGFERLGADAADNLQNYEDGWDVRHLKTLRSIVE